MTLSDVELICAVQSDGEPNEQARRELLQRFGARLRYLAGKVCWRIGLDTSEIDDVLQETLATLLDPTTTKFDLSHPNSSLSSYLLGHVNNAARKHARFLRKGDAKRHDYGDPQNLRQHLPVSAVDIPESHDAFAEAEFEEEAAKVLAIATPEEAVLIRRVYFESQAALAVGRQLGVAHTTVARRLRKFARRAAAASESWAN